MSKYSIIGSQGKAPQGRNIEIDLFPLHNMSSFRLVEESKMYLFASLD